MLFAANAFLVDFFFGRVCAVWSLLGIKVCGSALLLKMPWGTNLSGPPGGSFFSPNFASPTSLSSHGLTINYPLPMQFSNGRPPHQPQWFYPPISNMRLPSANSNLISPQRGLFIKKAQPLDLGKFYKEIYPSPSNTSDASTHSSHNKENTSTQENSSSISTAFDNEKGLFSEKVKEHLLKVFEKYVDLMRSKKKLYNRNLLSNHDLKFYSAFPNNKIHEWQNEMISLQRFLEKHNIQVGQFPQEETES